MPSPVATTSGGTAQTTKSQNSQSQPPMAATPFVRASAHHKELINDTTVTALTGSDQNQTNVLIPAYGYLRGIFILVQGTGGASTPAVVFSEDGPWNVLKNLLLQEPNGAPIAQFNSGYDLYLANKYGGYFGMNDPKSWGNFSTNTTNGNFQFLLYIPIEINLRDSVGSLPNQNAAAMFQLRWTIAANTTLYTTPPGTTQPAVRVRMWAAEWDQPSLTTDGKPNETVPPAMNTTQFWTVQTYVVNSGLQTIRLNRVGNYLRELILEYRRTSSSKRSDGNSDWPDTTTLFIDARPQDFVQTDVWRTQMAQRGLTYYSGAAGAQAIEGGVFSQDNGVFVYDFCHEFDGRYGRENRDLWLPTYSSTRLELQGTFANAGTLTVLTNDVTTAGNVFYN